MSERFLAAASPRARQCWFESLVLRSSGCVCATARWLVWRWQLAGPRRERRPPWPRWLRRGRRGAAGPAEL